METLAAIIEATLETLAERDVIEFYDDAIEFHADMEIEGSLAPDGSLMVWSVKAFGWYVFLWQYGTSDSVSVYAADEICQAEDHTSHLPLQDINGQRLCVDCAEYTQEQINVVYADMLRHDFGDKTAQQWIAIQEVKA